MEIIFEFICMLLIDGCFDVISNPKINILIRKIVLGIVTFIYIGLIFGFTILIIKIQGIVIKMIFIFVIILILIILIKLWIKVYRNKTH